MSEKNADTPFHDGTGELIGHKHRPPPAKSSDRSNQPLPAGGPIRREP